MKCGATARPLSAARGAAPHGADLEIDVEWQLAA